jgi:hypothetical protein
VSNGARTGLARDAIGADLAKGSAFGNDAANFYRVVINSLKTDTRAAGASQIYDLSLDTNPSSMQWVKGTVSGYRQAAWARAVFAVSSFNNICTINNISTYRDYASYIFLCMYKDITPGLAYTCAAAQNWRYQK